MGIVTTASTASIVAEPRIVGSVVDWPHRTKETHAGGILEDRRAIAVAQFAGVCTQRCDFYVLRPGKRGTR